jgi:ribosome-associated toxin RatA of RatAB toxin-antitoxin module
LIRPYRGAPEVPILLPEDLEQLNKGKPVMKQVKEGSGGRGIAIQDVHASPEVIWSKINDFANYPGMVENVRSCKIYEKTDDHIKVSFTISAVMMNVEYFIDHVYHPSEGYMTWTLDYFRESDLDDSVGFWRVEPIPSKPGWTRVFYSVEVRLKGWIPGIVEDMIAKKGLPKATGWVKRESEKAAGH